MNRQKNNDQRLIAGAMSGTSADGVDVAIVAISGRGLHMSARLIHHGHLAYPPELRHLIFAARQEGSIRLANLAKMGREITLAYAQAIQEALDTARLKSDEISCVAAHGQTLFHQPPETIQWFDPSLLAAEVGCPVVSDFRRADCAAGGQGAPLVPFADYILFRDPEKNRLLLNIGGIANITWLKAGGSIEEVVAFDTGPGNCISDYL
jgi:anhydro-N-acetylmuramic acid kinase